MWYNPLVTWLLRSPLRRLMEGSTLLLTYTGRKSGRTFTFPISYAQTNGRVRLITGQQKTWWKNVSGGAPVQLWLKGQPRTGHAHLTPLDHAARVEAMQTVYRGMPRRLAEQQSESIVVVDVTLDPSLDSATA
jgi:hypothetical protein